MHAERIGLDGKFLNRIRIRAEVCRSTSDVAGYVQAIHDKHVAEQTAAVRAGIDRQFGGKVVWNLARQSAAVRGGIGTDRHAQAFHSGR